jgi:PASTA domain
MAARLSALLPRIAALTLIWLLAASAITFAASGHESTDADPVEPAAENVQEILIVPDVRQQAYVFAKGILEDGGFAWRVEGPVEGYAANTVASQNPAPGTKVMDTGAPIVVLHLQKNADYAQNGLPENKSSRTGTAVVLADGNAETPAEPEEGAAAPPATQPTESQPNNTSKNQKPAKKKKKQTVKVRKPAFVVPGAPAEPLDEMPLPDRARLLEKRLSGKPKPTPALVNFWLYQHAWLVTGAQFGWSGGADALRILVRVDHDLQSRWDMGGKSAAVAEAALAEVERRSGK